MFARSLGEQEDMARIAHGRLHDWPWRCTLRKFCPAPFVIRSTCIMPKLERKTIARVQVPGQAEARLEVVEILFGRVPFAWTMAPFSPVRGSVAVGSNCDCCPYLVENGDS